MSLAKFALPAFAGVLIVGGVVVALWMFGSASGERAKFSSLEIAPQEADTFFAINTDPTSPQWLAVNDSLGALGAKDPIREAIDEALAEVNLDWEEDILPVAGDEAFFSVPSFEDVEGSSGFVAGFQIADEGKAQEVFDDLRERAEGEGEELSEEEYEGVTIYFTEVPSISGSFDTDVECFAFGDDGTEGFAECDVEDSDEPSDTGAVALFDGVLAIGGSTDDVKSVIDVVQGRAPSAEENERLQEFRELQKDDFLMWGYADLATVWDIAEAGVGATTGGSGGEEPFETPEPIETPEPTVTPVVPGPQPTRQTGFRILSFDSDAVLGANGELSVTELIEVDYGDQSQSVLNRDIAPHVDYDLETDAILEVREPMSLMVDGVPEEFTLIAPGSESFQGAGATPTPSDIFRFELGNDELFGRHTYELKYVLFGAVHQYSEDPSPYFEITHNSTGNHWGVPIENFRAVVRTPGQLIYTAGCNVAEDPNGIGNLFGADCISTGLEDGTEFTVYEEIPAGWGLGWLIGVEGLSGAPVPQLIPEDNSDYEFDDFLPPDFDDGFDSDFGEDSEFEEEEPLIPFDIDTEELFEQLRGTYDRVGFSVSSTSDGFAFDVTVLHAEGFEPENAFEPTAVFDSHFAESVPAETMFFFAGYDLYGQNWLPARSYFEDVEFDDGKTLDDFLDDFADETGLDLEDDILSLLTGEYAVAGDVSDWDENTPDFSVLTLLDVSDEERAQETLDDLGAYLSDQDLIAIDDDGPVQRWTLFDQDELQDAVGVAVHDGAIIAGYPDSAVEDAVAGVDNPLASTDEWKRTIGLLPDDTTSIGFVSIARLLDEARAIEAEEALEDATDGDVTFDDLEALRSIGFATTSHENGFAVHAVVFVEDQ